MQEKKMSFQFKINNQIFHSSSSIPMKSKKNQNDTIRSQKLHIILCQKDQILNQ